MKIQSRFLRSKVAKRVVLLFFLSALVPIAAIAFFSLTYVNDLLIEQSYKQLKHSSKLYGMAILDRLLIIDDKLHNLSINLNNADHTVRSSESDRHAGKPGSIGLNGYEKQIDALTLEVAPKNSIIHDGNELSADSKSILFSKKNADGITKIYLRRIISIKNSEVTSVIAEINNQFLWGEKDSLPFSTFLCVINNSNEELFCSHANYDVILANLNKSAGDAESRKLTWEVGDDKYLAVAWDLFVKSNFSGQAWKIIASRPETDALLPLYAFHKIFPLVILFSLLVVLLLSLIQVRRSMVPLERLVEGTRRLANYKFSEPVEVSSQDEFKELADSFNLMAGRLEKQFNALKILSEIDRLILISPDLDVVLARIFDTAYKIISCDYIAITLIDKNDMATGWTHIKENAADRRSTVEKTFIPSNEAEILLANDKFISVDLDSDPWLLLDSMIRYGTKTVHVYRILLDDRLRAIFSLGYRSKAVHNDEESVYVRDIIDRLAVALATADREEKLYQQAHFDFLTGLPNRQLFNDRLDQHIIQAHRKSNRAALLYIDLDRFKNINDSLGHVSGDTLLRQVSERMRNCIRETDTISRLGGDEFVIALSNITSPKDASNVAKNIIDAISLPFIIQSSETFISASIGIAIYPEDGKSNKELLTHADAAMYRAKENGRGRYMFFEDSMNKKILQRIEMETAMRHALRRKEFILHYQPQVDPHNGNIKGVEALIRWNHPQHGLVPPKEFIPLAEECGLIDPIGEWVLETACKQYQTWQKNNIAPGRLAVNISSRQFMRADFVDVINKIITNTGILSQQLELEITESLLLDERINAGSIFSDLAVMGVNLAIDDFGTGYSSLGYLKSFPVNILKIDRTFTKDVPADNQATTLTLSIIAMAHALNMQVVAEGVETKEQLEILRAHKCDFIQGYYFSRPLPAEELVQFLSDQPLQIDN